jgi:carboxypeptidase C (cathepsin A)
MSVRWNFTSAPSPTDAFQSAMKANPHLRVMVGSGCYDLVFGYFAIEQAAAGLTPDLARRVTVRTYSGGHAIYTDDGARRQLRLDGEKFYQAEEAR